MTTPPAKSSDFDNSGVIPSARGLICVECGGRQLKVVYTRPAYHGKLVRRRECKNCRTRLTTWEMAIRAE